MPELEKDSLDGQKVVNRRDELVGKVDCVLYQGDRKEPDWLRVKLGHLGLKSQIIPLEHVHQVDGHLQLLEEREWVQEAPQVELEGDRMSDEDADRLRSHYGLERLTGLAVEDDDLVLPRETRDIDMPGLDEGPDDPIAERRRERAKELGIPSAQESDGD